MAIDITFLNNNSVANITTNFQRVEAALEEALSRTGNSPNQMTADLDLNNNNIINVGEVLPGTISAANYVTWAEEWANKAEDSLVSFDAGGNGIDEYSAKHWAAKAEDSEAIAVSQGTAATASAAAALASETAAAASATAASGSASAAATSASNASTSETNAATSETNSATSASNASTSESNAATSASNASTSETNAASSASAASTSASNAATSEANAAASYDQFDDRYLGAKAADPTLDNDGDALIAGALYFNTTSSAMRVYDGSAWGDIANTVSRDLYEYTATAGQTVFSGADRHGNSLSTGNKFLNVHLNGARLTPTDDYTFDASSVTFASALNLNDEVFIEALNTFEIVDGVLKTSQVLSGAEQGQVRANIGADLLAGHRNKIINGDFDIWQRATSQTTNGYGSVDRWLIVASQSNSTSRQDFTVGQTDVLGNPTHYLRAVLDSDNSTSGGMAVVYQNIEDVRTFSGETVTVTFWAKADSAKDIAVELG